MAKQIPTEFSRNNFIHTLVERDGDYAIYVVNLKSTMTVIGYEVCLVRKHKADNDFINVKEGDEYLPSTGEWGRYGWSLPDLGTSRVKIQQLKAKKNDRTEEES